MTSLSRPELGQAALDVVALVRARLQGMLRADQGLLGQHELICRAAAKRERRLSLKGSVWVTGC